MVRAARPSVVVSDPFHGTLTACSPSRAIQVQVQLTGPDVRVTLFNRSAVLNRDIPGDHQRLAGCDVTLDSGSATYDDERWYELRLTVVRSFGRFGWRMLHLPQRSVRVHFVVVIQHAYGASADIQTEHSFGPLSRIYYGDELAGVANPEQILRQSAILRCCSSKVSGLWKIEYLKCISAVVVIPVGICLVAGLLIACIFEPLVRPFLRWRRDKR